jgi:hypothetical protein
MKKCENSYVDINKGWDNVVFSNDSWLIYFYLQFYMILI